jgi:effector-binding domain-containing protein
MSPQIVERAAQPYVAVRGLVTMQTFADIADRFPEVFGWLARRGIEATGAPFFRYRVVDMERGMEIEAGVPVASRVDGEDSVYCDVLPAGGYATVTYVGHPAELVDVTASLLAWASKEGLAWDMARTDRGERWASRLEFYKTDPAIEPDMTKWEVELAFKLAD